MNADTLLENFEVLAEAPGGVDRLRDLILGLAINGLISGSDTSSWRVTTLGDEVQIVRGITFPSSAKGRSPGRGLLPCLRTANIQNEVDWEDLLYVSEDFVRNDDQYVQLNDLLISMANSRELVGKVALVRRNDISCTLGGFIAAIRCGAGIDPKYLMTILRVPSAREKLIDSSTQTTNIANISLGRLRPFVLSLPPLAEQKRIVAKVDELMALCDQLEQQQKQRDNLRIATRKSAIDSISTATTPEELEAAWKRINNNWEVIVDTPESIDAMRKLILDLYTTPRIDQSDFFLKLGQVVQVLNGDRSANYPSKEQRVESGIPFINAGHLQNGDIDMSEMDFITPEKFQSLKGGKVQDGDILFCLRGSLGKCAIVRDIKEGTVASSLAILRPNEQVNSRYLLRFLQSGSCSRQINKFDNGSAQPNLAAKSILNFELFLPALSAQNQVVKKIDELMALCDQLEARLKVRSEVAEKFARSVVSAA